jgi:hypothetical protein
VTWGRGTLVHFAETVVDRRGDIHVVLLQEHEVSIALDTNVGKLDPLEVGEAHLFEVLDEAVIVRDVRAGLACDHDVRHLTDLGELVDCASLENARTLACAVLSDFGGGNGRAVRYWWVELQRCVGETTRPSSGTTNASNGGISDQRRERDVARLDVDVGTQQIRACVGPDGGVGTACRMADRVRLANHAEKLAPRRTHSVLHVHVGRRDGNIGGREGVKSGISARSVAGPLCMDVCLGVVVEVFRSCEALLIDDIGRTEAERVLGEKLLATSAVGSNIDDVDLVALVEVVGSPTFAVVWRIQPFRACVDARRNEDHRIRFIGLSGGRELLNVELVAPHLLARDSGVDIATADVKEVSLVRRLLTATFGADAFDTSAVVYWWQRFWRTRLVRTAFWRSSACVILCRCQEGQPSQQETRKNGTQIHGQ